MSERIAKQVAEMSYQNAKDMTTDQIVARIKELSKVIHKLSVERLALAEVLEDKREQ